MDKTMKQQIIYQLVDTAGEISAIVRSPVAENAMPNVANRIMRKNTAVEQVGFIYPKTNSFRMMGGELSVNGMLAAEYLNSGKKTIQIPRSIVRSVSDNQIVLTGMTYVLLPNPPPNGIITITQRKLLRTLATTNPAAGIVYYNSASIKPLLFVRATNTYVWEQSCGSGSIAYALWSGRTRIRQPSDKIVTISITNKRITYQAPVRVIGSKEVL